MTFELSECRVEDEHLSRAELHWMLTNASEQGGVTSARFLRRRSHEAWRPNDPHECSLFGVSRERVSLLMPHQTDQKDRADLVAQLRAMSEALRTKIDDVARSGDPMPT